MQVSYSTTDQQEDEVQELESPKCPYYREDLMKVSLPTPTQQYIHVSKYSRWIDDLGRRETWPETVKRYMDFMYRRSVKLGSPMTEKEYFYLFENILYLRTMPSMRAVMTAGKAAEKDNVAVFNCSFTPIDHPRAFSEILYILACGTGVGFSVERQEINELPEVPVGLRDCDTIIVFRDSKLGWAQGLQAIIDMLYNGQVPQWDLSKVRRAGARLKTFGGRACLTGDTLVYKDRKKSRGYNEISIKDLYEMKNRIGRWAHLPDHFSDIRLRSLDEESGSFYRNQLVDVIHNGVSPVYEVLTDSGYRIKATSNHRFLDETGNYKSLEEFSIGDLIAVNGSITRPLEKCLDCDDLISRRAVRCRSCADKAQIKEDALLTTARQRKECRRSLKEACERCGALNTRLTIHHKDKNPYNNSEENLETLCEPCHQTHHAKERSFGDPYSHRYLSFDNIISIEYVGEEEVFDLAMEGPNHNFVANGYVSHNSGPQPLEDLIKYIIATFRGAQGRKLVSLEVHGIVCKIGETIVSGGVRRSALISLSNLSDDRMRNAKSGEWWTQNPHYSLANNSAAYTETPDVGVFMEEWLALYKSKSGERGIFNRRAAMISSKRTGRRNPNQNFGTNPCSEIILPPCSFCNLSEIVIREEDTLDILIEKVRAAVWFGVLQSSFTEFRYLRKIWQKNAEDERLLGVSLTGIMDNALTNGSLGKDKLVRALQTLKAEAIAYTKELCTRFGLNMSVAITCVKPSGTVSQLVNSSSGIHSRFGRFWTRRYRENFTSPIFQMLADAGIPWEPDPMNPNYVGVFSFPMKAPASCVTRHEQTALDQLELWLIYKQHWAEHSVSVTVYVKEHEWFHTGSWVYDHFDEITGVSFLPFDNGSYRCPPYEETSEEEYNRLVKALPEIDWSKLSIYEKEDQTESAKTLACTAGACELA